MQVNYHRCAYYNASSGIMQVLCRIFFRFIQIEPNDRENGGLILEKLTEMQNGVPKPWEKTLTPSGFGVY